MRRRRTAIPTGFPGLLLGLAVFGLSAYGKHHFGPLDALCNGSLEFDPNQGTGAIANCSLDTSLYSLAVLGFWLGIAIAAIGAVSLLIRPWDAPPTPVPVPSPVQRPKVDVGGAAPTPPTEPFCGSCGARLEDGDRFCAGCGAATPA